MATGEEMINIGVLTMNNTPRSASSVVKYGLKIVIESLLCIEGKNVKSMSAYTKGNSIIMIMYLISISTIHET